MNSSQPVGFDSSNPDNGNISNTLKSTNNWKDIVSQYEKRNASLEHRQAQLSERLHAIECALPSMLMSAMVSMYYGTEPPKMDLESVLSKSGIAFNNQTGYRKPGIEANGKNTDGFQVELVYKRKEDFVDPHQKFPDPEEIRKEQNPASSMMKTSVGNSQFATGDDGRLNHKATSSDDRGLQQMQFTQDQRSTDSALNLSVMSSRDLLALSRIQELAEQERLLKRYICDLESRERTFCETLERANRLLNDPLVCVQECIPICSGAGAKEPLSDDPVIQRLQKLEFYNQRMISSMKGLRQEKNVLIKQTELLKTQLRNTQEKLGEVQKEVLGEAKVIPVMGEASFTTVKATCSCASNTNKENSAGKDANPKTLLDLAGQFEDVLQKAKNHGLCKLSGTIKDAAMKLKELSKSEKGYKCICDCPCDPVFNVTEAPWKAWDAKQDGPCPNCNCGKFDVDKLGETGDWFCDSCGGECVCDLVSLDEDSTAKVKSCECGCQDDEIACECGCGITNINEVGEAGDIPMTVARKLSEDLKGIICKDCGNCKCGDDHSNCPNCIEACTCSCTTDMVPKSLLKTETQSGEKEREVQDPDTCGPRCACNDSDVVGRPENNAVEEFKNKFIFQSGKSGNPDFHPCFECEQPEPCAVCLEEELNRLQQPKKIVDFGLQKFLPLASVPCEQCLRFGTESNKDGNKISPLCNLCQVHESTTSQAKEIEEVKTEDLGSGDQTEPSKIHDLNCPCSCNATVPANADQCLCGCGVTVKISEKEVDSCPCGCGQTVGLSNTSQGFGCDCECAKGGVHCDYCCCVDSILELLKADKKAHDKSPETCPCIEDSIRQVEMDQLAKTLQQEVDCIGKKNYVLQQFIAQCACTAPEIIEDSSFTEGCPYHDPAPIRPTISGLKTAIDLLRAKSRSKDGMIAVLAENLGGKVDSGKIIEKLGTSMVTEMSQDFDQCRLYNYLKGSELSETIIPKRREYLSEVVKEDQGGPDKFMVEIYEPEFPWSQSAVPMPRDFKLVKQICNDCLLVAWTPPNDISMLNGYELLVNGYVASRIRSPTRTEALLISLDTSRPVIITLYSLGPGGLFSEPVRITYPACLCVQN